MNGLNQDTNQTMVGQMGGGGGGGQKSEIRGEGRVWEKIS